MRFRSVPDAGHLLPRQYHLLHFYLLISLSLFIVQIRNQALLQKQDHKCNLTIHNQFDCHDDTVIFYLQQTNISENIHQASPDRRYASTILVYTFHKCNFSSEPIPFENKGKNFYENHLGSRSSPTARDKNRDIHYCWSICLFLSDILLWNDVLHELPGIPLYLQKILYSFFRSGRPGDHRLVHFRRVRRPTLRNTS